MSQTDSQLTPTAGSAEPPLATANVSHSDLELGCINLISQLEIQISSARRKSGHVEKASDNTDKLLTVLLDFCEEFLGEQVSARAMKDIEKASFASLAHKEVLGSLSWGFAIQSLFGKSACADERVRLTYEALGEALLGACVSVLRQAVTTVGFDTSIGKTIEQSTAVFVEEFRASW
jgi:hypothetical protein